MSLSDFLSEHQSGLTVLGAILIVGGAVGTVLLTYFGIWSGKKSEAMGQQQLVLSRDMNNKLDRLLSAWRQGGTPDQSIEMEIKNLLAEGRRAVQGRPLGRVLWVGVGGIHRTGRTRLSRRPGTRYRR